MSKKLTKSILLIIIMVIAVIGLTGCTANPFTNSEDKGDGELGQLVAYTAEQDYTGYTKCEAMAGVEFYYPSNYVSVGTSTQPMYMDPEIPGASVNLVSSDMPSSFTFEGYIDASIIGIKSQMTIEGDINKEYINLNGVKAAKLDYVATSEGQTMTITQVALEKDEKVYILTVGGLQSDAEAIKPKMEKMVKSFK